MSPIHWPRIFAIARGVAEVMRKAADPLKVLAEVTRVLTKGTVSRVTTAV